jgi:hypothetical protein
MHSLNSGRDFPTLGGSAVALHGHVRVTTYPAGRETKDDCLCAQFCSISFIVALDDANLSIKLTADVEKAFEDSELLYPNTRLL